MSSKSRFSPGDMVRVSGPAAKKLGKEEDRYGIVVELDKHNSDFVLVMVADSRLLKFNVRFLHTFE